MDLLKSMMENRKSKGMDGLILETTKMTITPARKEVEKEYGTRRCRRMIIEEKPKKKEVMAHLQAIIDAECESSSEEEE
jgi:hypothetical protein